MKKRDLDELDFCPLCKDLGGDVKVGFHKARAAVAAPVPAVGKQREGRTDE